VSVLVVGSVALDSIETPFDAVDDVLGGSAVYFSHAASYFSRVRLVGVVGDDFPEEHVQRLKNMNVDTAGLHRMPGRTFRWKGRYDDSMDSRETLDVQLNVLGDFRPDVPETFRTTSYVFLANSSPALQRHVLAQMQNPKLAVCDTMNLYIDNERDELVRLLGEVDGLVINDAEAVQFTGERNLVAAGNEIIEIGPKIVVIKKGSNGSLLFVDGVCHPLPAYPTTDVNDPTGAGDSFAGGMMGYLAAADDISTQTIKRAVLFGTVMASFNIEDFSMRRYDTLTREEIDRRAEELIELARF